MRRVALLTLAAVVLCASPALAQRFTPTYFAVAVNSTTSTVVAVANNSRNSLLIINDSDTNVYCKIGAAAVAHEGFLLVANGGGRYLDYKFATGRVECKSLSSSGKVILVEDGSQ